MSKYIVRCLMNGTYVNLATPARNPGAAVMKAQRDKLGRRASAFIVFERKTGNMVHATVNR